MGRKTPRKQRTEAQTPVTEAAGARPVPASKRGMWLGISALVIGALLVGRYMAKPKYTSIAMTPAAAPKPPRALRKPRAR